MSIETSAFEGIVHGKTIELNQEPGLPDGQAVTVTLTPLQQATTSLPPGEGLRRAFGAWVEDADELDKFLEELRQSRKRSRPEIDP